MRVLAQVSHSLGGQIGSDGKGGLGPFVAVKDAVTGLTNVTQVISAVIGVMTVAAGIFFIFNILIAGFQWVTAGGDKHGLEQAQQRITGALIGLVIVIAGWTILSLAGKFLGYDILISNPANVIRSLSP